MHKWTIPIPNPIRVDLLLFNQFSNHCLANCLEPMRAANNLTGRVLYEWKFFTPDGHPVTSSSGLPVMPDATIGHDQCGDLLYVLSSYNHMNHNNSATQKLLNDAARRSGVVVGLDTGAYLMAGAGLLAGRKATVHWDVLDAFSESFLDVDVRRERFIIDGNRASCAGAMAAFDMALEFMARQHGEAIKLDVANLFMHDTNSEYGRRFVARHDVVRRALQVMRENLEMPVMIGEIADQLGCHEKYLIRKFELDLGESPGQVYRYIRLSAARDMIAGSELSIAEIAVRVGYESSASLSRAFKARFGIKPLSLRK